MSVAADKKDGATKSHYDMFNDEIDKEIMGALQKLTSLDVWSENPERACMLQPRNSHPDGRSQNIVGLRDRTDRVISARRPDSSQISPSEGTARIIANMAPLLEDLKDPMKLIFPELPKEIEVDIKNSSSQDGTRVLLKWVMKQSDNVFRSFCSALSVAGYHHLLTYMNSTDPIKIQMITDQLSKMQIPRDECDSEDTTDGLFRSLKVKTVEGTDTNMHNLFKEAAQGNNPKVFPMRREVRGVFLLINNVKFKESYYNRRGSEKDAKSLQHLFKELGFHVILEENRIASDIRSDLKKQAKENHQKYDCFAFAVLSHGNDKGVYGTDREIITRKEIVDIMNNRNCPTLIGKPKLFFFQTCQGDKDDHGVTPPKSKPGDDTVDSRTVSDSVGRVPIQSETVVFKASLPGYISLRNIYDGSYFVKALVDIYAKHAHKHDLSELNCMVKERLSTQDIFVDGMWQKQMPKESSTLTKKFYFFPGLHIK